MRRLVHSRSGVPKSLHAPTPPPRRSVRAASLKTGGARGADKRAPELAGELPATEDPIGGVRSFLEHGPGHARYQGR
jgi:enoyl-CoA hydratase